MLAELKIGLFLMVPCYYNLFNPEAVLMDYTRRAISTILCTTKKAEYVPVRFFLEWLPIALHGYGIIILLCVCCALKLTRFKHSV
jgi:hypothetical protein